MPEKKNKVCAVEAQGNEKTLVNASPSAGHLDPEIPRCSVVPEKKTKEGLHVENDGKGTIIARVHIQHMVQGRRRNKVVEGNKW